MKPAVRTRLDEIMATSHTQITCHESSASIPSPNNSQSASISSAASSSSKFSDRMDIEIMGTWLDIERAARLQTLIYLDELNGFAVRPLNVGFDMYPIIIGRKRAMLNRIMEDSGGANIYLPNYLMTCLEPSVFGNSSFPSVFSSPSSKANNSGSNKRMSPTHQQVLAVENTSNILINKQQQTITSSNIPTTVNHIYITGPIMIVEVAIAKLQHLLISK
ncbi:hypothetical protein HK100_007938, partial [Physocladia obscura]